MNSQLSAERQKQGRRPSFIYSPLMLVVGVIIMAAAIFAWAVPARSATIPTISISSVLSDQTVTVQAQNFPANQNFIVTMGPMGTQGVNGYVGGLN